MSCPSCAEPIYDYDGSILPCCMCEGRTFEPPEDVPTSTLIHTLWGQCKDGEYSKEDWKALQTRLEQLGIL